MSPQYTSEQEELRGIVRKFLGEKVSPSYLRKRIEDKSFFDSALWQGFNELGMFAYFEESSNPIHDLSIVAYECGRSLCPENIVDAMLAGPVVHSHFQGSALSNRISDGAYSRTALHILDDKTWKSAVKGTKDYKIDGEVSFVNGTEAAEHLLIVPATLEDPPALIELKSSKVSWKFAESLDLTSRVANSKLKGIVAARLKKVDSSWMFNSWCTLRAAELAGAASACVNMTAEYVKTRKQFGVPVGAFQAVQHRLADAYLKCEALESLAAFAAWCATASPEQFALAARAALWYGRTSAPEVIESAIQLHGGTGFTWEFDLHLYLRRAKAIEARTHFLTSNEICEQLIGSI